MRLGAGEAEAKLAKLPDHALLALTSSHGDNAAFSVFYARHRESLISFLWRRTGNHEIAQDLAAEAFATAFLKVGRYDPKRGDGRAWLFGIARVAMLASYRQHAVEQTARRQLGLTIPDRGASAWEEAEARLEQAIPTLVVGLEELSTDERDAVIARVVDERDYADIARTANISEAAIRQRVSRGLRKLSAWVKRRPQ